MNYGAISNGIGRQTTVSTYIIRVPKQLGGAGPENLLKMVSRVENEKLQELMVRVQME